MKYWVRGSDDEKVSESICLAFDKLGYSTPFLNSIVFTCNDSVNNIYFTWGDDNQVYHEFANSIEGKILLRLIELDDTFVELNPNDIIIDPSFEVNDVICDKNKTYKRAIIIGINKHEQKYRVKDYNNFEFSIPFVEQDQWGLVIKPKFKKGDMIKSAYTVLDILEVETQFQRYKVSPISDVNNIRYIAFDEQDAWDLTKVPF